MVFVSKLRSRLVEFYASSSGVSAIEFAFAFPLMFMVLAGSLELSRTFDNRRKVTTFARTVADLVSQGDATSPIPAIKVNDMLSSSKLVLRPYDATKAKVVVSAIGISVLNANFQPTVCSSYSTPNASPRSVGQTTGVDVPLGFQLQGMRFIMVEVSMPYAPLFGSDLLSSLGLAIRNLTFTEVTHWPVRGGKTYKTNMYNEVVLPSGNACP
ncbi:MAG: pilus assembly protein [Cytophagaceae bacterium]|nr:MAG: pilus assembly protein [Cytophagaceae bacterium]